MYRTINGIIEWTLNVLALLYAVGFIISFALWLGGYAQ